MRALPASGLLTFVASALVLASAASGCNAKAGYPSAPVLLVCPWAVGGGTDRVSRYAAMYLEEDLGVPVNVINATGGGGVTGHARGAHARPDGYTLTMMTVELNILRWRRLSQISWEAFTPLLLVNRDAAALFVRPGDGAGGGPRWANVRALVDDIRKSPATLTASGTTSCGIWHLALAGWLRKEGLKPTDVRWIPTNGAGPSLQELASGGVDMVCCSLPEADTLLEAREVVCLGVMADARQTKHPDVPTFREQGFDWTMGGWRGLGLPSGVPEPIVARVLESLRRIVDGKVAVEGKTFMSLMADGGFDASVEFPGVFRETLRRTDAELGALIQSPEFAPLLAPKYDPFYFPRLLGWGIAASLALIAWESLRRRRSGPVTPVTPVTPVASGASGASGAAPPGLRGMAVIAPFLDVIVAVVFYVALAEALGFLITAAAVLVYLALRFGVRIAPALCLALILVPGIYQLFCKSLGVPLPRGLFGW